jgi:hypothetical protein
MYAGIILFLGSFRGGLEEDEKRMNINKSQKH